MRDEGEDVTAKRKKVLLAVKATVFVLVAHLHSSALAQETEPVAQSFSEMLYTTIENRAEQRARDAETNPDGDVDVPIQGGSRRRRGKFPPRRELTIKEEFLTPPPEDVLYSIQPKLTLDRGRPVRAPELHRIDGDGKIISNQNIFGFGDGEHGLSNAFGLDHVDEYDFSAENMRGNFRDQDHFIFEDNVRMEIEETDTRARADKVDWYRSKRETVFTGNVHFVHPAVEALADRIRHKGVDPATRPVSEVEETSEFSAHPVVPIGYSEELRLGRIPDGHFEARNFDLFSDNRYLIADYTDYDTRLKTGTIINARGRGLPIYFAAEKLEILGPLDMVAEDVWITTCDYEVPHYRLHLSRLEIRDGSAILGEDGKLQVGGDNTIFFLPRLNTSLGEDRDDRTVQVGAGREPEIGYYTDFKYWLRISRNLKFAARLFPTTEAGIGAGINGNYDYRNSPTSPLFRSRGEWESLYTTEERGYLHYYHEQELTRETRLLLQTETWSDADFYKDFFYDDFVNRTGPRTFANVTHTAPKYIASATVAGNTNSFLNETERLPELSFHIPERSLGGNTFVSYDAVGGYYQQSSGPRESGRFFNGARLTYDWQPVQGINVTPFAGVDVRYYTDPLLDVGDNARFGFLGGATAQTRLQKAYPGLGKYSGFKHVFVPSITYLYEASTGLDQNNVPHFDALDDGLDRSRIASRWDNLLLAKNATNGETWPIAQVTFFQGNDLTSDVGRADDYELVAKYRPRPWWGITGSFESHEVSGDAPDQDFDRLSAAVFYDNAVGRNNLNALLGIAELDTPTVSSSRELIYGVGYRFNENWAASFQHRYNLDLDDLSRQEYQIRRRFHRWDMSLKLRDRPSGFGFRLEFSLIDFPGTKASF